ncbi:hypothetical protein JET74_13680 [Pseudomonas lactis]|uniref:hypothetical protein n=1 Tax=Pseudomonas lactis TaxID=1615674 RepID=UPI0018E6A6ED|nr:hypothetical protein [Pseudomonas lactis]MBI6976472.1 hypothetical protein [Pseudomonas lactis]
MTVFIPLMAALVEAAAAMVGLQPLNLEVAEKEALAAPRRIKETTVLRLRLGALAKTEAFTVAQKLLAMAETV